MSVYKNPVSCLRLPCPGGFSRISYVYRPEALAGFSPSYALLLRQESRRWPKHLHPLAAPGTPAHQRCEYLRHEDVPQSADHATDALPLDEPASSCRALCWFVVKAALTGISVWLCFEIIRPPACPLASWIQVAILICSLRPILSDLHHGNNNLVILFLIVATLQAWRKGYDVLAGLILALAICYKVTPLLFVPYLAYKRSWRAVGATVLGMGVFLLDRAQLGARPAVQRRVPWDVVASDAQSLLDEGAGR